MSERGDGNVTIPQWQLLLAAGHGLKSQVEAFERLGVDFEIERTDTHTYLNAEVNGQKYLVFVWRYVEGEDK